MTTSGAAAVCFDLDLTLCVTTQDRQEVLAETFDRVGVEQYCDVGDVAAVGPQVPDVSSDHEFFAALYELAAERVDRVDPEAVPFGELASAHLDLLDHSQVRFRDGAEAALDAARERGPVGLVTNGSRDTQTTKLEALGIADAFDVAVFCDPSAGMPPKPDPKPLRTAVDALGVDPAATLHVGDSKATDVAGAHAAGVRSAWVPYEAASDDADHEPDHVLDAPADLLDVL